MKRLFAMLLVLGVFAGITAGIMYLWHAGSGPQKGDTFELIVKGTGMDFWKTVNEGAQAAASTYNVTVTFRGPEAEKDYSKQVGIVDDAIARRPNAIILAAVDYSLLARPVQDAIDAGIPVLMVDSNVNNSKTIGYVGTDNMKLGTMLAQQLTSRMKGVTGQIGVVSFVRESYPAVQREEGFRSGIRPYTGFTLLDTAYGDSDIDKTEYLTANLIAKNPKMVAIAALNAQASTGAARALSKLGRRDIQLYAIDCTPEEAMYMEEGIMKVALLQNPYQMGYYSVETVYRYLHGERVSGRNTDIYTVDVGTLFDDQYQQLIFPFNS